MLVLSMVVGAAGRLMVIIPSALSQVGLPRLREEERSVQLVVSLLDPVAALLHVQPRSPALASMAVVTRPRSVEVGADSTRVGVGTPWVADTAEASTRGFVTTTWV